ncbi:MAG: NUDIX domain-containing protein [Bacteroidales bacterium]|nr:NUDIX domain-containing protein [Bacteroidales bacterium]
METKAEHDSLRDYCGHCKKFFYDNPLPVVSCIVTHERKVLLVKRSLDPNKGEWCLPMGFAETGESIEAAALRELQEETGIIGRITGLLDVVSGFSKMYGDLIFITFEAEQVGGKVAAGDDAEDAGFFPFDAMPKLPFASNIRAIEAYLQSKQEYWAIVDSFSRSTGIGSVHGGDYLSDKLLRIIESNAETIGKRWFEDVKSNKTTHTYSISDEHRTYQRFMKLLGQFSKWLGGTYSDLEIRDNYKALGKQRKEEGFMLSEVLSALSLIRKHIWEFALSHQVWNKTIDIYMSLELERRMVLFFDKASFYVAKGYEED